ncbi:MAG: bifunctional DNA-formamidopyrimidine glycosylase/DNA-(apurinic or apyrimidinic site) lyase [Candidatus Aminicenantaceae bacterium]
MPELPEVETIVQSLSPRLQGLEVCSFDLIFPGLLRNKNRKILEMAVGKKVMRIRRRGKMILFDFDSDLTLIFHLKMTGQFFICSSQKPVEMHTRFIISFKNQNQELRFNDVRKFGYILCLPTSQTFEFPWLGPEPLEIGFSAFRRLFENRKARLKSLLLNQNFIAGIGNIYADEISFQAKLHPLTPVSLLEEYELKRLWKAMRFVLKSAIDHRGSSIRDFRDADGRKGRFQNFHRVYGRESLPCPRCGEKIKRLRIGGRSSFFCPNCQKERMK